MECQILNFKRISNCKGTNSEILVIEPAHRSGTNVTAKLARQQGKKYLLCHMKLIISMRLEQIV